MPLTTDSIAQPWQPRVCRETDAPASASERAVMTLGKVPYTCGMEPTGRTLLPGYDSGVLCLVIGIFLILAYNSRHYSTFLKHFWSDLWSVRRRDDTFSVRTFTETGMLLSIVLLASVCQGIIINSAITFYKGTTLLSTFPEILALSAVSLLYYLWEVAAYSTVGFVFTDKFSCRQWLKGFNASQVLLGLSITIPALFVLFNPDAAAIVVPIGITIYVICRLLFICKGFRLFYDNFGSLLYFILYLCTLEIVPIVLMYRGALFLTSLNPKL